MSGAGDVSSVGELISHLELYLKDIVELCGLNYDNDLDVQAGPNLAHPLSFNTVGLRQKMQATCETIEQHLVHYRDETLSTEESVELCISDLTERATAQKPELAFQLALAECLDLLKSQPTLPGNAGVGVLTRKLQDVATEVGLQLFSVPNLNDDAATTITIAGNILVLDIELAPKGTVRRVKLEYASENAQHQYDDMADQLLLKFLRDGDFSSFTRNLGDLALLDKHSGFQARSCLENDLLSIHKYEMTMSESTDENHLTTLLLNGHGLPTMHCGRIGTSLVYWASPLALRDTDWNLARSSGEAMASAMSMDGVWMAAIVMEPSKPLPYLPPTVTQYLVEPNTEPTVDPAETARYTITTGLCLGGANLNYYNPLPNSEHMLPLEYVMVLNPPVPVALRIARQIMGVTATTLLPEEDWWALEDVLTMQVPSPVTIRETSFHSGVSQDVRQEYRFGIEDRAAGVLIRRIPFRHSADVFPTLMTVRRQILFNHLFQSCFNFETYTFACSVSETMPILRITLVEWVPGLRLSFLLEAPMSPLSGGRLDLSLKDDLRIDIRWMHNDGVQVEEDILRHMTHVLETTLDVSISIQEFWDRFSRA
ncbi:Mediator of RNA polymerase II transcription subunit 1 [Gaertneriomyces sp. JEL0708]|nr:Mediator of RNA polymerase II transcription subunit 1 [Gaertneriomyces sp. JEL0708]